MAEETSIDKSSTEVLAKQKASFQKAGSLNPAQEKRKRKLGDLFTGRRKTAVARIKMKSGSGKFTVNGKEAAVYFSRKDLLKRAFAPLDITEKSANYDVFANVKGGGITGQAEAVAMAVARCLDITDSAVHKTLRQAGLLTRDPRMVERKKYGLHKADRKSVV